MQAPFPPLDDSLMDVHGAGSQRSDPKDGVPADYPHGHGPQGDVIRIFNLVRCVRDAALIAGADDVPPAASPPSGGGICRPAIMRRPGTDAMSTDAARRPGYTSPGYAPKAVSGRPG